MYTPKKHLIDDESFLLQFIQENNFGLLVSNFADEIHTSHLPFFYRDKSLFVHMARANPQWKTLLRNAACTCIFQGPHAYISPSWYETTPSVPTWDYSAVHIKGEAKIHTDQDTLNTMLQELTDFQEAKNKSRWKFDPHSTYNHQLSKGIVGIEINIVEISSRFKFHQKTKKEDRDGVINALKSKNNEMSLKVAQLIEDLNS